MSNERNEHIVTDTPLPLQQRTVSIVGVRIHSLSHDEVRGTLRNFLEKGSGHFIATVNPEFLVDAQRDARYRAVLNSAALAVPDGTGVWFASVWKLHPLRSRTTGIDVLHMLGLHCQHMRKTMFLVGGFHGVADQAAEHLRTRYPGIRHISTYEPSMLSLADVLHPASQAMQPILAAIAKASPDVLVVALGGGKRQEYFVHTVLTALPNIRIGIGVGGTLDYFAGVVKRAPIVTQRIGLEWLWRLMTQPMVRWRRIVKACIVFPVMVICTDYPWKKSESA